MAARILARLVTARVSDFGFVGVAIRPLWYRREPLYHTVDVPISYHSYSAGHTPALRCAEVVSNQELASSE